MIKDNNIYFFRWKLTRHKISCIVEQSQEEETKLSLYASCSPSKPKVFATMLPAQNL